MGLFQDSLKKWFYTNNTSAASSDARVPLLNANGTPKGSDTMANFASVLGAYTFGLSSTPITTEGAYFKDLEPGSYNVNAAIYATMPDRPTEFNPISRVRVFVFAHAGLQYKTIFIFSNDVYNLYRGITSGSPLVLKWSVVSASLLS